MGKMRRKVPQSLKHNVRYQALLILLQVRQNQAYSNLMIKRAEVSDKDRGLLSEIVYGTISYRYMLEYQLHPFIKGKKVDAWVKELLLLSLYQMYYLSNVPDHAILNDAVSIAKACGNIAIGKFVNGVLRNSQRQGMRPVSEKDPLKKLSIQTSMPLWLLQLLNEQYGLETTKKIAASQLLPSRVSARMTQLNDDRQALIDILNAEGLDVEASEVSPFGIVGKKGFLAGSTLFKEGRLTIQDESSMLVAPSLQLKESDVVLDACAAPGGKTTHIASYLNRRLGGKVIALDIHQHKSDLILNNVARLGLDDVVETKVMDARDVKTEFEDGLFDKILIDAPCSGLGLIRRKPDIKYTKTYEDLKQLTQIQQEILDACAPKLKDGGLLVYSTCTINKEENEAVVAEFIKRHPQFEIVDVKGSENVEKSVHHKQVTLLPSDYFTDGFFICCLQKKNER